MPELIDISDGRFGRITVLRHVHGSRWLCRCDCGTEREFSSGNLRSGRSTSCGCYQREYLSAAKAGNSYGYKHGHAPDGKSSPEYRAWAKAKDRCHNPRSVEFKNYGARGIAMCDEWRASFASFLADMGERPDPNLSLDRIDNDGNYEPGNCRWATQSEQNANRRPYRRRK